MKQIDKDEIFSDREMKILKAIGKKRYNTISTITEEVFGNKERPFDAEITIGNSIRRIIKKCEVFKLHWTLVKRKSNFDKLIITKEML